jgi:hypothetical protein
MKFSAGKALPEGGNCGILKRIIVEMFTLLNLGGFYEFEPV